MGTLREARDSSRKEGLRGGLSKSPRSFPSVKATVRSRKSLGRAKVGVLRSLWAGFIFQDKSSGVPSEPSSKPR